MRSSTSASEEIKVNLTQRIRTMTSRADDTRVPIELLEQEGKTREEPVRDGVMPMESMPRKVGAENKGASSSSSPPVATTDEKSAKGDPAEEFRERFVSASSNPLRVTLLKLFMAKSDEYPRFVWQDFLLSFQACLAHQKCQDGDQRKFGPYAKQKLSHIIDSYPDIFQRELLRDSFELADPGRKRTSYRYGSLHAAVLCGRVDVVYLIRDPDKYRKKICKLLTPEKSDESFNFIRRAVLWKHMHDDRASYGRVAKFMKEIEKVWKPSERQKLREFIGEETNKIDLSDAYDPWIIILAWSAASSQSTHIIDEFKETKPDLFQQILTKLEERGSAITPFLSHAVDQNVSPNRQGHGQRDGKLTVQNIIKMLVLEKDDEDVHERDAGDREPLKDDFMQRERDVGDPEPPKYDFMQKFFLDRLSERTPGFRWSPLHLAAARGDSEMVSLLIRSCDTILKNLGEETKSVYLRNIQNSFHDVKYMTPLHYAVLGNHKGIVKSLTGWQIFHPHVNDRDIYMRTAFQIACIKLERQDIAEQLVESKILDVDTMDCCSFTGVHWAVYSSCIETARVLLQKNELFAYKEGLVPLIKEHAMKGSQKLLLNLSSVKNEIEGLYRDRQVYVDASNAILVGAALIASVTYGGWLQPPLGKDQNSKISMFWAFNSLSFFFSIATVMAGAAAVLPVGENNMEQAVESIRKWLVVTSFLLIISVTFVLGAFAVAGFSSLSLVTITNLNGNMAITTSIGSGVCATIGFLFCLRLWSVRGLNQIFKEIQDLFKKEEILKIVKSVIQEMGEFLRRIKGFFSAFLRMCVLTVGLTKGPLVVDKGILVSQVPKRKEDCSSHEQEGSLEIGPQRPQNLEVFLKSIPTLAGSGSEPYGVHHKKIEEMWKAMHSRAGSKKCPIRDSYVDLESSSWDDIVSFNIGTEAALQEYIVMWRNLSLEPLKDSPRTLTTVKKIVDKIKPSKKPTESYVQGPLLRRHVQRSSNGK